MRFPGSKNSRRAAKKSVWSKINRGKIDLLHKAGRMKPPGHAAVEAAKADGRWEAAYDSQKTAVVPEDFSALLKKQTKANTFFSTLKSASRFAIIYRLQTVKKPERRDWKMQEFMEMMKRGEAPFLTKPKAESKNEPKVK